MLSAAHFEVFERYRNAGPHAFSTGEVSDADKGLYDEIFEELKAATQESMARAPYQDWYETWSIKFGRSGGVQGHRPLDLWSSVINKESSVFGSCKLPEPVSEFVEDLSSTLASDGFWTFQRKTRERDGEGLGSLANLISYLRSPETPARGGGAVVRFIEPQRFASSVFDLAVEFARALDRFSPLMRMLTPSKPEQVRLTDQEVVQKAAQDISEDPPLNMEDARVKALRLVALRLGQAKFREKLFEAYDGRCAVTGTFIPSTLQAAHIVPYRGPETNGVQNGLLLRADIHNLFDLGLIQIDPETLKIAVAKEIQKTKYGRLNGRVLRSTRKPSQRPSSAALIERLSMYS